MCEQTQEHDNGLLGNVSDFCGQDSPSKMSVENGVL